MTREELHSTTGFHPASLLAAAMHLRATMSRNRHAGDATSIIKNEGHMNGYLDAIELLIAAASPLPPQVEKKKTHQPYSEPAQPQTENQNRP